MSPRNHGAQSHYGGGYRDTKFNGYGDGKEKQHFSKGKIFYELIFMLLSALIFLKL